MAFVDDFTGSASTTSLEDSAPSGGTAWTQLTGDDDTWIVTSTPGTRPTGTGGYTCDNQGSANQYVQARFDTANSIAGGIVCRFESDARWVMAREYGTGASGRRLSTKYDGTIVDLHTSQYVDDEWLKVEADGTTIRFYEGGTGSTPSWTTALYDAVPSETISSTETKMGLLSLGSNASNFIFEFEAGALSAASAPTLSSPTATSITATGATLGCTVTF